LIEIAPADGSASMMLPFTETMVPTVDVAQKKIVIAPPVDV